MPQRGRSRRAAARQTQLGQKKKRHVKGPADTFPILETATTTTGESAVTAEEVRPLPPTPTSAPAPRLSMRRPAERATVYNYGGPEVKRIFILSGGVLALLIVLSFLLR